MEHHRVVPELRPGPPSARLIGEMVVEKRLAFAAVAADVAFKLERVWSKDPNRVQHMFKWVLPVIRSQKLPQAALTSATWLNACGKLPRSSPLTGSTSSASRPTSLTKPAARPLNRDF
jgi:hypothetical protein